MSPKSRKNKAGKMNGDRNGGFKEKITDVLELPRDVVLNVPRLTMVGASNLIVENYKGIMEYDNTRIRLNTNLGILKITGQRLVIKEITSEDVIVDGEIQGLEFIR